MAVRCLDPPAVLHGAVVAGGGVYGAEVGVACSPGYTAPRPRPTCLESGRWSGDTVECRPVTCPHLPSLLHGTVEYQVRDTTLICLGFSSILLERSSSATKANNKLKIF